MKVDLTRPWGVKDKVEYVPSHDGGAEVSGECTGAFLDTSSMVLQLK